MTYFPVRCFNKLSNQQIFAKLTKTVVVKRLVGCYPKTKPFLCVYISYQEFFIVFYYIHYYILTHRLFILSTFLVQCFNPPATFVGPTRHPPSRRDCVVATDFHRSRTHLAVTTCPCNVKLSKTVVVMRLLSCYMETKPYLCEYIL